MWLRAAVVILLVTVAGLSTLAKNSQYFPKTNPAQHLSISTKMNVAHAPAVLPGDRLQVARISPPPSIQASRLEQFETAPIGQIGIAVSKQHRSPPVSLA